MNSGSLEIKNISKCFSSKRILNNISYSFENGNIYAILGKSGSGKTTLLNILGLLDNKFEGDIILDNKIISKSKDNFEFRNRNIGWEISEFFFCCLFRNFVA